MELVADVLIDCQGRVTHRLVLRLDGTVSVTSTATGITATVDPSTGTVLTPGVHLPDQVVNAARAIRVG